MNSYLNFKVKNAENFSEFQTNMLSFVENYIDNFQKERYFAINVKFLNNILLIRKVTIKIC